MAVDQIHRIDISDEQFAPVRAFLARFGIAPDAIENYSEKEIAKAITAQRGWEVNFDGDEGMPSCRAIITEWRTLTQSQSAVARDPNRKMALLRALRIALSWPRAEDGFRDFDRQTRALLGISAEEFFVRLHANQLSLDDPTVVHLMIARPLGW